MARTPRGWVRGPLRGSSRRCGAGWRARPDSLTRDVMRPADRLLRGVIGGLARRHDWPHALDGAIALAGSLLKRGRPQDARAVLADAKDYATRAGQDAGVIDVAIFTGLAWIDLARLDEAEGVLQAALAASRSSDRPSGWREHGWRSCAVCSGAAGTRRRATLLASMEPPAEATATRVAVATASSRIAIGRRRSRWSGRERDRGARHRRTGGRTCASGASGVRRGVRAPRGWRPCRRRP